MAKQRCPIGAFIMELYSSYIDEINKKAFKDVDYKQSKDFRETKVRETDLAKLLEIKETTFSNYLIGISSVPKEVIISITEKLHLNMDNFIELSHLYASQEKLRIIPPFPESEEYGIPVLNVIQRINVAYLDAITGNLLLELAERHDWLRRYEPSKLFWCVNSTSLKDAFKYLLPIR